MFPGNGTLNKHAGIDYKQLSLLAKINENQSGEVLYISDFVIFIVVNVLEELLTLLSQKKCLSLHFYLQSAFLRFSVNNTSLSCIHSSSVALARALARN